MARRIPLNKPHSTANKYDLVDFAQEEEEYYDEDEEGEEEEDFEDQLAALTPTLSPTNIVVQLLIVYPLDTSGFSLLFQLAGGYVETSYNSDR